MLAAAAAAGGGGHDDDDLNDLRERRGGCALRAHMMFIRRVSTSALDAAASWRGSSVVSAATARACRLPTQSPNFSHEQKSRGERGERQNRRVSLTNEHHVCRDGDNSLNGVRMSAASGNRGRDMAASRGLPLAFGEDAAQRTGGRRIQLAFLITLAFVFLVALDIRVRRG